MRNHKNTRQKGAESSGVVSMLSFLAHGMGEANLEKFVRANYSHALSWYLNMIKH